MARSELYVGVDLAADPKRTGVALLREVPGRAVIEEVSLDADDDAVLAALHSSARTGVDVPFGWPDPFVALISAHAAGAADAPEDTAPAWRRTMAQRTTDVHVRARTGLVPLSVSTDRIAYPALRWVALEARLRAEGMSLPRDGSGRACEVYPAAALHCWGLPHRGYKSAKNIVSRRSLIEDLRRIMPWLEWRGFERLCRADDNALDAVIAALVAREMHQGRCEPPPPSLRETVSREGWIWFPTEVPAPPA